MADFSKMRTTLQAASEDIKTMNKNLVNSDRYAEGLVKSMADLASMTSVKGSIWSVIGRFSKGQAFFIQKQLRGFTVLARVLVNIERDRIKEAEKLEKLMTTQGDMLNTFLKSYKDISSIEKTRFDRNEKAVGKAIMMQDTVNKLKLREMTYAEVISKNKQMAMRGIKEQLSAERKVIQELGEGYKLTEKNSKIIESTFGKTAGLGRLLAGTGKFTDAFKDVGKDLFGAGGPLQQLFDPTFFETKEISQQFLALKEEVEIFTGMLNDENTELEKQQKKKEKLEKKIKNLEDSELKRKINKERLREERKNLSAESGEDADYLQSLGDVTEITVELEAAKKRLHELDIEFSQTSSRNFSDNPEFGIIQAEMREERNTLMAKDFELQEKLNFIEQRKLQATEAGLQTSEELAARKQEIDEGLNKIISREIKDKEKKIELQKQLDEMDFKTQEELIASITEQKELRETEKGFLEESLAERGVKYDEGKEALSFPTGVLGKLKSKKDAFGKLKKGEQAKEIIKKLGLPLTGLFATVKGAFMAYMTKKNFNKIFRMAGLSIKVFAQILYLLFPYLGYWCLCSPSKQGLLTGCKELYVMKMYQEVIIVLL